MEQPKIEIDGKTYHQVGCRKCGKGTDWNIYFDGKEFTFVCKCGNALELSKAKVQSRPDEKPIMMGSVM